MTQANRHYLLEHPPGVDALHYLAALLPAAAPLRGARVLSPEERRHAMGVTVQLRPDDLGQDQKERHHLQSEVERTLGSANVRWEDRARWQFEVRLDGVTYRCANITVSEPSWSTHVFLRSKPIGTATFPRDGEKPPIVEADATWHERLSAMAPLIRDCYVPAPWIVAR